MNCIQGLVTLEKSYHSYMVLDKDNMYMKIVAFDKIYKLLVLLFYT